MSKYFDTIPHANLLAVVAERVTHLTTRSRTIMPLEWVVKEVNATVRGWVGYFLFVKEYDSVVP